MKKQFVNQTNLRYKYHIFFWKRSQQRKKAINIEVYSLNYVFVQENNIICY